MADSTQCGDRPRPAARKTAPVRAKSKKPAKKPSKAKWTKVFLAELAATSNVSASAKIAGVTSAVVYETRRSDPEFNRAWRIALCEGYDALEMALLQRFRDGESGPGAGRANDNATALRLLGAHREVVARERAIRDEEDADAILASINAKLEKMRERSLAAKEAHNHGG